MVATCSPHGDAGGTLHFPSPTHIHHVDPSAAFRQLRRSLSRSPSKGPTFRLITSKSTSPSPSSPLSPPLLSPPNRSVSEALLYHSPVVPPSPLAIPYPLSARQNRQVVRRLSPMRMGSRSASSQRQRSPSKRTLSDSSDHGNATPRSSGVSSDDIENRAERSVSPLREKLAEKDFKYSGTQTPEWTFAPHRALSRVEKGSGNFGGSAAKSSPLKRSDGIMNLDQASLGSPSAKRRSLHGGIFSPDFNIFDHEGEFEGRYDGSRMDATPSSDYAGIQSPLPRRTSSLRKTTLQQRHEKPTFARSKPNLDLTSDFATPGQAVPKSRFRMSLDNFLPSMPRDSPFSSQGSLPNASAHLISQQSIKPQGSGNQAQPPRHPLSRSLTQSSSNSSMAEDSPTHIPIRQPEHRKVVVDFSKSMPLGSARPVLPEPVSNGTSSQVSAEASFATPENYKLAKPLPAAFMSTGLISKRNRNIDDTQVDFRSSMDQMPDTPCKRHSMIGSTTPAAPEIAISKARHARHSFGTPSTPFNTHATRPAPGTFGKGVSVFGSNFAHGSINRRGSFLGVDVDDQGHSMHGKGDSQSSVDFELPPTPTKQALAPGSAQPALVVANTLEQAAMTDNCSVSPSDRPLSSQQDQSCKLIPIGTPSGSAGGASDSLMDDSPSIALRFRSLSSMSRSLTHSRLLRNSKSPAPLKTFHTVPSLHPRKSKTKRSPLLPASPIHDRFERMSPHTPREHVIPPDPGNLSISAQAEMRAVRPMDDMISSPTTSMFVPATPTASRESFLPFGKSRSSINSSMHVATADVDPSLTSRFDKVDLIGTGEFSSVFRVTKAQEDKNAGNYFSLSTKRTSPKTPLPDRVWAVKKTRHPYIGPKDRQRKLQEVAILKALGQADHTVNLFDSWENTSHLYIQTEFCEEGSLKVFLDEVGRNARLDDFRIWKVLLELSLVSLHSLSGQMM